MVSDAAVWNLYPVARILDAATGISGTAAGILDAAAGILDTVARVWDAGDESYIVDFQMSFSVVLKRHVQ